MFRIIKKPIDIKNIYIPKDLEASKKVLINKNLRGISSEDYINLLKRLFLNLCVNRKNTERFYRTFNALNIKLTYKNLVNKELTHYVVDTSPLTKLIHSITFVNEPLSKLCKILILNDLKSLVLESSMLFMWDKLKLGNRIDEYKMSEKYFDLDDEEAYHEVITCLENAEYEFTQKIVIDYVINTLNQVEKLGLVMTRNGILIEKLKNEADSISLEPSKLPNKTIPKNYLHTLSNEFDKTSLIDVYNFFAEELVNKKYLSKDTLLDYIRIAFQDRRLPDEKFRLRTKERNKIIDIFYRFYSEVSSRRHGTRDQYIKLLSNYFENFDFNKVKNNFRSNT